MRLFLPSMLTIVLAYAAVAQNGSPNQDATSSLTSAQAQNQLTQNQSSGDTQKPLRPTELYGFRDTNTCFFIRSYNFERRGTDAPVLKNMTTCTPAKTDQFRQTEKRPKVRPIPAN